MRFSESSYLHFALGSSHSSPLYLLQLYWRHDHENWLAHTYRIPFDSWLTLLQAFGYNTTENDEFVRIAEEAQLAMVRAARLGQYLVDFFPILKHVPEWMPGADFQRVAREGLELANELLEKPFNWATKQLAEGKAEASFFTSLMETKGTSSEDPVEELKMIRQATALMYAST